MLVLGAGGFLGPHLVRAALAAGARRVVAVQRGPELPPGVGERDGLVSRAFDLLREDVPERLLDDVTPHTVLLSAALARADDCARDPGRARAMNVELPARVAAWCARRGTRLVHISTDLVFGGRPPAGERYTEEDAPSPVHEYGRTKAAAEQAVLAVAPAALVVRLPLLHGDSGGRGLGASDSLLAVLARGERPRLFQDEWRTPLDAADASLDATSARRLLRTPLLPPEEALTRPAT